MADPEDLEVEQAVRETEKDLLRSAFEPKEKESEVELTEEEVPKGRSRDPETGRFARTEPQQEEQVAEQPEAERTEDQVPSWRLREITEERRRVEAERDQLRTEFARMQAEMAQLRQSQPKPVTPPPIDPVLDPQGFAKQVREEIRAEFNQQSQSDRLNTNLEMAHLRHGQVFEKAYEALIGEGQRGNNALVRHMVAQPNPGEAIVRWFTQNEVMREVGGDIPAYKQKTRAELLKDPDFLAEAVEAHRAMALGNGQQPRTVVKLPPSLSKATGQPEVPTGAEPVTDGSDAAIFANAWKSKRR